MTRDPYGRAAARRQADRRREPRFAPTPMNARGVVGLAALVVVVIVSGAFVIGAVVNGSGQPELPALAAAGSPSASPSTGTVVPAGQSASGEPAASQDPGTAPLPPGEIAWVPVVRFWSTANSITEAGLKAALTGGNAVYDKVIVPAADRAAIEEALQIDIAGSVKSGTPDEIRAAIKKGALGLLRASDVTPAVRALGIGKRALFGISRVESLDDWPLRGEVLDPAPWDQARTWTLVAGGDILLDRGVALQVKQNRKGVDFPYDGGTAEVVKEVCCSAFHQKTPVTRRTGSAGAVRSLLTKADLALANLESPIDDQFVYHDHGTVFSGDPKLLDGVKHAGFDFVSLANNHIRDAGSDGIMETIRELKKRGIAYSGAGKGFTQARKPAVLETHGVTVAIFGCDAIAPRYWTSGTAVGSRKCDRTTLVSDIERARETADVVVVYPHWGIEYRATPTASQRRLAAAWARAGADVVIGNHPHWAAAMEDVDGTLVWYALGNLVFDQTWSTRTMEGLTIELTFEGDTLRQARLRPHLILDKAQPNLMDPTGDGAAVLNQVRDASRKLLPY